MKTFNIQYVLIYSLIFIISVVWTTTSNAFVPRVFQPCIHALTKRLYSPIETEQQMRDKGYKHEYIVGLDHTRENLQLADRLRTGSINPRTSHIEEFAALIDVHINYIEEGIRLHLKEHLDTASRLQQLELLKSEAQERLMSKQVTYRWSFFLNLRLAIVASPWNAYMKEYFNAEELTEELMTNNGIEDFWREKHPKHFQTMDQFPERVLIPTIQDLGKISINSTYGTGVHLIGLSNRFQIADGQRMSPFLFFDHDMEHALSKDIDQSQMARRVMQQIANLTGRQRETVESLFFKLTHVYAQELNGEPLSDNIEHINSFPLNEPEGKRILIRILQTSSSSWTYNLARFLPWF